MRGPSRLLIGTVGLQWLVTAAVAVMASRSESVFGDPAAARAMIANAEAVGQGDLPATAGPLFPIVLSPLASTTTDPATVSSVAIAVTLLVLAPLASYCILDIAHRIAGRLYAVAVALVWLLLPLAAIPFVTYQFEERYREDVLPAVYGLTVHPAYLAMVLALAAAMMALRAAEGTPRAGLAAGVLGAAAVACLPLAGGVVIGAIVALAIARRRRSVAELLIGFGAGLLPTLIWRYRALESTLALGNPSWSGFITTMDNFREFTRSNRLMQWVPIAGTVGLLRLARPAGGLVAGWLLTTAVVGLASTPDFDRARGLLALIPSWPAYALAFAAIPALVPTLVRRLGSRLDTMPPAAAPKPAVVWTLLGLVVILPTIVAIALAH